MAEREIVEIGGVSFRIAKFDAFTGLKVLGDLQKQFIAPFLSVLDGKEAGSPDAVNATVVAGVERVLRDMDGDKLVVTARRLLFAENIVAVVPGEEPTKFHDKNWQTIVFDVADLLELCVAVVKVNYQSVFTRAATLFGAAQLQKLTPASSSSGTNSPLN